MGEESTYLGRIFYRGIRDVTANLRGVIFSCEDVNKIDLPKEIRYYLQKDLDELDKCINLYLENKDKLFSKVKELTND